MPGAFAPPRRGNDDARAGDPLALPRMPACAPATHPRRDALAAIVFVVAIAAMGLSAFRPRAQTSLETENRTTAAWPQWQAAPSFTGDFERAFADRFGGRDALLRLHHRTLVRAFGVSPSPNVLIGRDRWLYFLGEEGTSLERFHRATLPLTDAALHAIVAELARRERFLAAHDIRYIVTVAPEKYTIYPEHLPAWAGTAFAPLPLDRLVDAIRAEGSVRFVDLRPPLLAAKARKRVYYATDSHWNSLGAEVAYETIMRAVGDALAPRAIPIAPPFRPPYAPGADVYHGDLARMTGDPQHFGEPDYAPLSKILAASKAWCAKRVDDGSDAALESHACDRADLPRAVVYRDSMAIPLVPLLSENFSRVAYVASRRLDPAFVLRERPDVVIEELVERSMLSIAASPMPDPPR